MKPKYVAKFWDICATWLVIFVTRSSTWWTCARKWRHSTSEGIDGGGREEDGLAVSSAKPWIPFPLTRRVRTPEEDIWLVGSFTEMVGWGEVGWDWEILDLEVDFGLTIVASSQPN